mmetsp:Transcript_124877/g.364707  ORF Transcript_124877/g.364707 Transcript_124877/m.364707 type:complete len:213 (-) Transcript_124877:93-731(-)
MLSGSTPVRCGPWPPGVQPLAAVLAEAMRRASMSLCSWSCRLVSLHSSGLSEGVTGLLGANPGPEERQARAAAAADTASTNCRSSGGAFCRPGPGGGGGGSGLPILRDCMVVCAHDSQWPLSALEAWCCVVSGACLSHSAGEAPLSIDMEVLNDTDGETGGGVRWRPRMRSCSASDGTPAGRANRGCSSGQRGGQVCSRMYSDTGISLGGAR